MERVSVQNEKQSLLLINLLSITIPLVVIVMLSFPNRVNLGGWTKNLTHVIGVINALTTGFLIAGLIFIKRKKINLHRTAMTAAFALGCVFLVCYVAYHISNPANRFGGEGAARYVYFFILITHIVLSLVVLPLVLRAMFYALIGQFIRHKSIVKYAYPVWLYVSASGVIVYLMLYHLYPAK
jgi:putative membrane protein